MNHRTLIVAISIVSTGCSSSVNTAGSDETSSAVRSPVLEAGRPNTVQYDLLVEANAQELWEGASAFSFTHKDGTVRYARPAIRCSGVVLDEHTPYILTAAHCFNNQAVLERHIGAVIRFHNPLYNENGPLEYRVNEPLKFALHPSYIEKTSSDFDINIEKSCGPINQLLRVFHLVYTELTTEELITTSQIGFDIALLKLPKTPSELGVKGLQTVTFAEDPDEVIADKSVKFDGTYHNGENAFGIQTPGAVGRTIELTAYDATRFVSCDAGPPLAEMLKYTLNTFSCTKIQALLGASVEPGDSGGPIYQLEHDGANLIVSGLASRLNLLPRIMLAVPLSREELERSMPFAVAYYQAHENELALDRGLAVTIFSRLDEDTLYQGQSVPDWIREIVDTF